jgi:hypothetical protein
MKQPINHFNLKCTMAENSVGTIVSAIYQMMEGPSKNKALDFAEVVRQFLLDLSLPELREFWIELKRLHPQNWPKAPTAINRQDMPPWTQELDDKAATAGGLQSNS